MLSIFPQLLFLAPFGALVMRIAVAVILALSAWQLISRNTLLARTWGVLEVAVLAALFVGAWTQAAALVGFVLLAITLVYPRLSVFPRSTTLLTLAILASLVVTGPGAIAFDLPL